MKFYTSFHHKFFAGLMACVFSCTAFFSPLAVHAAPTSSSTASESAADSPEAIKEAERLSYYNKEIDSNAISNWPQGPQIYADSAIVMEANTGAILYNKDMDKQEYPASITKIMTALLALENCSLDETITYSYYATHSIEWGSSSIGTTEGEELTVEESLYGLLLESANECANGLAEHVSGNIDDFVTLMNQKAQELGCTNTHFANPHGLHDENHYTSAHDMALIMQAALKNENFVRISGTAKYTMRATNKDPNPTYMTNHHFMIGPYKSISKYLDPTVIAGKTGGTSAALNTLVTAAQRNGMTLIVVTMRTHSTNERGVPITTDTALLLDYASNNFSKVNVSENETNFSVQGAGFFPAESSIFGSKQPLIKVNPDGYIVLPNDASFDSASPTLEFLNSTGENTSSVARLSYSYEGQPVGETTLEVTPSTVQEFAFDAETGDTSHDNELTMEKGQKKFIRINVKIILIFVAVIVILILLLRLIRRLRRSYRFRVNLPTKRSSLQPYRSKRRRRSRRKKIPSSQNPRRNSPASKAGRRSKYD